jgi:membrane-bound serine protease (ClpP class)
MSRRIRCARMRSFPRSFALLLALVAMDLAGGGPSLAAPITVIHVIEIEGPIDRPLLGSLERHLSEAEAEGAVVVLQLDTPGTLGQDGVALADRVARMEVPVIAWVGPAPARASGAGLLLMLAASAAVVAPGSQTGPLLPLDVLEPGDRERELPRRIQEWLGLHGRTVDLGTLASALAGAEALRAGIADAEGYTVPEVLNALDAETVRTASDEVVLHTRVATTAAEARAGTVRILFVEPGLIARVLHAVSTPTMVFVLLVLGLAGLAFEITQPGFGFAGFSGAGLVALAAYGLSVAIPAWPWLALMLAGIGLMVADVRFRSLSWPTWGGLAAFGVGSAMAWSDVDPAVRVDPWLIAGAVVASLLYYGFALTVALQSRDRIVGTQRGLIGLVGEARGRLAPDGPVFVKGALWRGRSLGEPIEPGTPIRVRSVEGLILRVEPEAAGGRRAPGP